MFKIIICIILILQIKTQKCEVDSFSAVTAMEKLLETQAHLIEAIRFSQQFVDKKDRDVVTAYLNKLKQEHSLSRGDPEHYLGNPINSYALIMRLFRDLQYVEKILNKTHTYKRNSSLVYPSSIDVDGAGTSLTFVHVMYGLDIQQLADGILVTHFSNDKQRFEEFVSPLTANDCSDLANFYHNEDARSAHVAWLEEAHKRYKDDQKLCPFTEAALIKYIAKDWNNTIYWMEKYVSINKRDYEAKGLLEQVKERNEDNDYIPKPQIPLHKTFDIDPMIMKLCRYESGPMAGNVSLSCYYAHGPHPYLLLAPFKAEILHRGPDITIFYNVISDAEIEVLKTHVKPKLGRSTVLDNDVEKVSVSWISQVAMVSYELTEVVRVLRRIQQFTGLQWSESTADKMIVGNYGIAGYYTPHRDFFDAPFVAAQRIATALLYLSNVEQGGATIFLKANLTVFPVKNAVLFWYNLDAWGNGDNNTIHASCPVVRGSKWVANQWIPLLEQDLSKPCPVHPPGP